MASLAVGISSFAQTTAEPNRLFLNDEAGGKRGYVIDRMSDITFGRVDGEVKAEVQIHSVEKTHLKYRLPGQPHARRSESTCSRDLSPTC